MPIIFNSSRNSGKLSNGYSINELVRVKYVSAGGKLSKLVINFSGFLP